MKEVKLNTQKKRIHNNLNLVALVDDGDFENVNQHFWQVKIHGATFYAKRVVVIEGKRTSQAMHRFILGLSDPSIKIDHEDRNGLNNQRYNIRVCTQLSNSRNRGKGRFDKRGVLSSIYKGVSFNKNRYVARIRVNYKLIYLGRFINETDAALAYNEAAIKYFGKFANVNSLPEN